MLAKGEAVLVPPMPSANSIVPFETPRNHDAPRPISVDVIFPVLHGTFGEDGTLQGLLELADIPYVGSGVLGSAAGMDKDIMKRLFCDSRLPLVKHLTVLRSEWERTPKQIEKAVDSALKYPVFVKPANLGSSVGISKAHDATELPAAMNEAARFDRKIIIEQGVGGKRHKAREIECAVLGNDEPIASICGEIIPAKEFYDYNAKYIDSGLRTAHPCPAGSHPGAPDSGDGDPGFPELRMFGAGPGRFPDGPGHRTFLSQRGKHHAGFHRHQYVSQAMGCSGIEYPALIDRLIQLALERHADKKRNQYTKD